MLSDNSVQKISKLLSMDGNLVFEKLSLIDNKERRMSYSLLKNMSSPINFVTNYLKPSDPNAGMSFGSVVDTMITCPEKFESEFVVSDLSVSDGNQKDLATAILNSDKSVTLQDRFTELFPTIYKRGKPEDYQFIIDYCEVIESGKRVVSKDEHDKAKQTAEMLLNSPIIEDILSQADGMQESLTFEYKGWKFKSILDIRSLGNIYDLKFMSQLNPDVVHRDIDKYGYDLQMGIYRKATDILGLNNINTRCYFMFYDKSNNFALMEFTEDYVVYAQKKMDVYLNRLEKIIREDGWCHSYDFFNNNMKILKPAYMKAFSESDYKDL